MNTASILIFWVFVYLAFVTGRFWGTGKKPDTKSAGIKEAPEKETESGSHGEGPKKNTVTVGRHSD